MSPFLSIITCTKNSAKYLGQNIGSVRHQSFGDYEHLMIDGFSTDGTKEIALEYQKDAPDKVRFVQSEPKGIAEAMNRGIALAQGKYIMFLHSDDYLHDSQVLNDVADFLRQNGQPDWIYAKEIKVDSNGKAVGVPEDASILRRGSSSLWCRYLLKYYNFIRHQSVFIKKNIFDKYGLFNQDFPIAMDYEFWLRIKDRTRWIYFDRLVDCFRAHEHGISTSFASRSETQIDEMRAGRSHMNRFEFYVLRPPFKVAAKSLSLVKEQFALYRRFKQSINHHEP